jgi:hypothetical protein
VITRSWAGDRCTGGDGVTRRDWRRTFGRQITVLDADRIEDVLTQESIDDEATARARSIMATLPERYRRIL